MIKLHYLIKSVAYKHFCKTWSICIRKISTDNMKQMSYIFYKWSERLWNIIYNDDDCWFQEFYFFTEFWLLNVLMIKSTSSQRYHLYNSRKQ